MSKFFGDLCLGFWCHLCLLFVYLCFLFSLLGFRLRVWAKQKTVLVCTPGLQKGSCCRLDIETSEVSKTTGSRVKTCRDVEVGLKEQGRLLERTVCSPRRRSASIARTTHTNRIGEAIVGDCRSH